jgi:HlyD family secretion protein
MTPTTSHQRRAGQWTILLVMLAVIAGAVFLALHQPALLVDAAPVTRGPMAVTIDDEGETRVHDVFTVAAPLSGRLLLEPGDAVLRGQTIVARIVPATPSFLDNRTEAVGQAQERASLANVATSRARVAEARAERALADRDLRRMQALNQQGFTTQAALDAARMRHDRAEAAVVEANSAVDAAQHQLMAARAALAPPSEDGQASSGIAVMAPVSGNVLRVVQKSETFLPSGTALVEIGDPRKLEIVTDYLSSDAVNIAIGADVDIDRWGGSRPLRGKVRRIDPAGFMKISALGVEEQRVNVTIDIVEPYAVWQRLGHGFRVITKVRAWSSANALRVPVSALFRQQGHWAVYAIRKGRAVLTAVALGQINDEVAEVRNGLVVGDRVILHPGDTISDKRRVRERPSA